MSIVVEERVPLELKRGALARAVIDGLFERFDKRRESMPGSTDDAVRMHETTFEQLAALCGQGGSTVLVATRITTSTGAREQLHIYPAKAGQITKRDEVLWGRRRGD